MKVSGYEDVRLIPNRCIMNSRSECDTTVALGKHSFKMPVVPANMQTIIDKMITETLAENGYFYIMHWFDEEARVSFIKKVQQKGLIASISVGVREGEYAFVETLAREGLAPDYVTIDIAHGHPSAMINMIQHLKKFSPEAFVIAGNVRTSEAARELEDAGADATKVGIGPGKVCIIKIKTGFGTGGRQLAIPRWCAKAVWKPIIADGGIRTHGDIVKSVHFGATMVTIDSLFTGHEESPGETKVEDGVAYKEYPGSASESQKGEKKNVEGKKIWLRHKGKLADTLIEMQQDLQSSISYTGGRDLKAICKVDYVTVKNFIFNGDTI